MTASSITVAATAATPAKFARATALAAVIPLLAAATPVGAAEFRADVIETQGGFARAAELRVKGDDTRFTYHRNGFPVVEQSQPGAGLYRILDPVARTYRKIPAAMAEARGGTQGQDAAPCQPAPELVCEKTGSEEQAGVATEIWTTGPKGAPFSSRIWWDKTRHIALREEHPDGRVMQAVKRGDSTYEKIAVETWELTYTIAERPIGRGEIVFAPSLGVAVVERRPDGSQVRLVNIETGPQDAGLFTVPEGYKEVEMPPPQAMRHGPMRGPMHGGPMHGGPMHGGPMHPGAMHGGPMHNGPMHDGPMTASPEAPKAEAKPDDKPANPADTGKRKR